MRVTTDFWVSALVRRAFAAGGFAAVLRRGATEAGAVFVTVRGRMGELTLYGPAPQASYDEARPQDRVFQAVVTGEQEALDQKMASEIRFDPDVWLVELEADESFVAEALPLTKP